MKKIEDYLHLYIGQDCLCCGDKSWFLQGKTIEIDPILLQECVTHNTFHVYKPILRPLSDITEDEYTGIPNNINTDRWILIGNIKTYGCFNFDTWSPERVRYLCSKGFDLFGLIEAGLAIDKNPVNN